MSNDQPKGTPVTLIYAGRREGVKYMLDAYFPVQGNGLGSPLLFKAERSMRTIGCMYKGARLENKPDGGRTVYGLTAVQWTGERWPDDVTVQGWHIESNEADANAKRARLEKDADRSSPIEQAMLPVRQMYAEAQKRGDWAMCRAFEDAVLRALRRRPSSKEKSE